MTITHFSASSSSSSYYTSSDNEAPPPHDTLSPLNTSRKTKHTGQPGGRRGSVSPAHGTEGILSPEKGEHGMGGRCNEWVHLIDDDGNTYYLNLATNVRQTSRPTQGKIVDPQDPLSNDNDDDDDDDDTTNDDNSNNNSINNSDSGSSSSSSDSASSSSSSSSSSSANPDENGDGDGDGDPTKRQKSKSRRRRRRGKHGDRRGRRPTADPDAGSDEASTPLTVNTTPTMEEMALPTIETWDSMQTVDLMTYAAEGDGNKNMTLRPKKKKRVSVTAVEPANPSAAAASTTAAAVAVAEAASSRSRSGSVAPLAASRVQKTSGKSIQRFDVYVLKGSGFFKGFKPRVLEVNIRRQSFAIITKRKKKDKRKELRAADVWRFEKCKSDDNKLFIIFEGKAPTYTILCLSPAWRELIYQTLWATHIDAGDKIGQLSFPLSLWIGSWNMGNAPPPESLGEYLPQDEYDMYAFCVQECKYSPVDASGRKIACETRDHWYDYVERALGPGYVVLCKHSLWEIRLVVAVRACHYNKITDVEFAKVATGIANVAGNKGGVAVAFSFFETTFCFIGSHLAAHQSKISERNEDYVNICAGLGLGPIKDFDITNVADYVFWCGDLNYRIDLPRDAVIEFNLLRSWDVLFANDQLQDQIAKQTTFVGFVEAELDFPCTYKYDRNTRTYAAGKHPRIPAWCDRILWRCLSPAYQPEIRSFSDYRAIMTSDHSPVSATLQVSVQVPYRPVAWDRVALPCSLILSQIEADMTILPEASTSKPKPFDAVLVVQAPFLPGSFSLELRSTVAKKTLTPAWDGNELPLLRPSLSAPDYLAKQSIILAVFDAKSGASRGEAKLPLGPHILIDDPSTAESAPSPTSESAISKHFDIPLLKSGLPTGRLTGAIVLRSRG